MKETQVQKDLIAEAIEQGGFGWQLNNRFIKGIADILVKLPTYCAVVSEVKMCPPLGLRHDFTLTLTEHQVRFLCRYRDAGGYAGWIAVGQVPKKAATYNVTCGVSFVEKQIVRAADHPVFTRKRGEPWPIRDVVEHTIRMHNEWRRSNPSP